MKFQDPGPREFLLKSIWEYECTIDGIAESERRRLYEFPSGGNVEELPDQCLFASVRGDFSKIFIVSEGRKVLWSAIPELWSVPEKKWVIAHQFSANIITRNKDLETLIWNQSK